MDSLTQIVLGAACGEAVLGKKAGNRALIWGGIGGTIPDLDVVANLFLDPMEALAFHRGPTHSLLFAATIPFLLAWLVHQYYKKDFHHTKPFKWGSYIFGILFYIFFSTVICVVAATANQSFPWIFILIFLIAGTYFFYKRYYQYITTTNAYENITYTEWVKLFFWSLFTHPILDSFTTYGTQLFWPFSNMRISLSNISIVDPFYTLPFALFLGLVALSPRLSKNRRWFSIAGLSISTAFMIATFANKLHTNDVFEKNLKEQEIPYTNYMTSVTILNNALWYCVAQNKDTYYYGLYSIFDKDNVMRIDSIKGNHHLVEQFKNDNALKTLTWFSDGYYAIMDLDSCLQYNDLRYGTLNGTTDDPEDFIFHFELKDQNGILEAQEERGNRSQNPEELKWFRDRVLGRIE